MVRAVALNCSPLMDKGNTALILNPFMDGMNAAGAPALDDDHDRALLREDSPRGRLAGA